MAAGRRAPEADGAVLLARLRAYLGADDARADDVLAELEATLDGSEHGVRLAALRRAIDEIEYGAALAQLDMLETALDARKAAA
jgi:two-component system sensor histidine kinase/response regulator